MKRFFYGKYYKFIANDSFVFALIDSISNDGCHKQIITKNNSYNIKNVDDIEIQNNKIIFNVNQEDLNIIGIIYMCDFHKLQKDAMGPFKVFKMQCSHTIYSMYHKLYGNISINDEDHSFNEGYGYIEGDKGISFPKRYVWYNSIGNDYGLTLAIATIPFGLIRFTGLLCFIMYDGKEYRLSSYNNAKIIKNTNDKIIIKKGKYKLEINIYDNNGQSLLAPTKGKMNRIIKENVAVKTSFSFKYKDKIILEREDENSSLEQMF